MHRIRPEKAQAQAPGCIFPRAITSSPPMAKPSGGPSPAGASCAHLSMTLPPPRSEMGPQTLRVGDDAKRGVGEAVGRVMTRPEIFSWTRAHELGKVLSKGKEPK